MSFNSCVQDWARDGSDDKRRQLNQDAPLVSGRVLSTPRTPAMGLGPPARVLRRVLLSVQEETGCPRPPRSQRLQGGQAQAA